MIAYIDIPRLSNGSPTLYATQMSYRCLVLASMPADLAAGDVAEATCLSFVRRLSFPNSNDPV
ncbi:hypothetical protein GOB93_16065 [Acetobacter musti]|uniref:Uncharacterized protein n=1 Tax=Acetobacter musti TaxID=864732 RepID=A0ABX0JRR2_9PROT|nr:hypothetical protein [Acetobacter musti]NHN86146.1 hypothetical protein [Acetobacter musti]